MGLTVGYEMHSLLGNLSVGLRVPSPFSVGVDDNQRYVGAASTAGTSDGAV